MPLLQLLVGAIVGTAVGLIPLLAGTKRNNQGLAIAGFFACMICGAVMGILLAGPIGAVFYWLIVRNDDIPAEQKRSRNWLLGGLIGLCVVLGAAGFVASFRIARKKQFIQGFRATFMPNCIGSDYTAFKRAICECSVDETIARRSVDQLGDVKATTEFIKVEILPGCIEKARAAQASQPKIFDNPVAPVPSPAATQY